VLCRGGKLAQHGFNRRDTDVRSDVHLLYRICFETYRLNPVSYHIVSEAPSALHCSKSVIEFSLSAISRIRLYRLIIAPTPAHDNCYVNL